MPPVKVVTMITMSSLLVSFGAAAAAASDDVVSSPDPSACPSLPAEAPASAAPSMAALAATMPPTDPCDVPPVTPAAVEMTVEAGDLWFRPSEIELSASGTTTLTLVDSGFITHNLTVDELDLLIVASPRASGSVEIIDPPPGTYEFYCSLPGHREAGMYGTLIVE